LNTIHSAENTAPTKTSSKPDEKFVTFRPDLVAHEWGTFTQVIGSDGGTSPWWNPSTEGPTALPEFVKPVFRIAGKAGARAWTIRMETPVIYFYADREAELVVTVDESKVPFTEVYPNVSNPFLLHPTATDTNPERRATPATDQFRFLRRWDLQILPPEDGIGRHMPIVSAQGGHYRYAREVPDAWWVVNREEKAESQLEVEKFIFYRGAGDDSMPNRIARVQNESIVFWKSSQPVFLIETDQKTLRWTRVVPRSSDATNNTAEFAIPSASPDAQSDVDDLANALITDLDEAGLTREEAAAMVATWKEAWLGESGLRVLEILPREWVDEILPLVISPEPGRVERVFVARWELITPQVENEVLQILTGDSSMEDKMSSLKSLDLGRFSTAVFDRVASIRDMQFRSKYSGLMADLQRPDSEKENDTVAITAP
ncbi:MAG: hypothetical protein AAGF67_13065, partial [Verrucomicrobiota bacterium]